MLLQIPSQRVLVVHDDLDLPTGKVRLRAKGGHGGHNGMRSITQHLKGSQDFPRLKIGIGRPAGQLPVASFVLQVLAVVSAIVMWFDTALQKALKVFSDSILEVLLGMCWVLGTTGNCYGVHSYIAVLYSTCKAHKTSPGSGLALSSLLTSHLEEEDLHLEPANKTVQMCQGCSYPGQD